MSENDSTKIKGLHIENELKMGIEFYLKSSYSMIKGTVTIKSKGGAASKIIRPSKTVVCYVKLLEPYWNPNSQVGMNVMAHIIQLWKQPTSLY